MFWKKGENETKEERLSKQLDAALKKLERAERQIKCGYQHKESELPQSFDEVSNYSGPVVLSPVSENDCINNLTDSLWLSSP